jgi:hypothetical protein
MCWVFLSLLWELKLKVESARQKDSFLLRHTVLLRYVRIPNAPFHYVNDAVRAGGEQNIMRNDGK